MGGMRAPEGPGRSAQPAPAEMAAGLECIFRLQNVAIIGAS